MKTFLVRYSLPKYSTSKQSLIEPDDRLGDLRKVSSAYLTWFAIAACLL